jgi:hypothetical protein
MDAAIAPAAVTTGHIRLMLSESNTIESTVSTRIQIAIIISHGRMYVLSSFAIK